MIQATDTACIFFWTAHAADMKKAKEGGFHTVQSLIMNPRKVKTARTAVRKLARGLQAARDC
jgi:hypothetical protein